MVRRAVALNVSLKPTVNVTRDMGMENYLMTKPAKVVNRRRTAAIPRPSIPIGARGRRRSTSIMFIGLKANVDGQLKTSVPMPSLVLNSAGPSQLNGRMTGQIPSPPITPQRQFTSATNNQVAGMQKTSLPSTYVKSATVTARRLVFTPSPPNHVLLEKPDKKNTTNEIDFDGSLIGCLHYSSSDTE